VGSKVAAPPPGRNGEVVYPRPEPPPPPPKPEETAQQYRIRTQPVPLTAANSECLRLAHASLDEEFHAMQDRQAYGTLTLVFSFEDGRVMRDVQVKPDRRFRLGK
jgi:hypothetical protein